MTFLTNIFLNSYFMVGIVIAVVLLGILTLKYKMSKQVRCAKLLAYMSELQYEYHAAVSKDKFANYPELRKQFEITINAYVKVIKNSDYEFKKLTITRRKSVSLNEITKSDLYKEIVQINRIRQGSVYEMLELNSLIKDELAALKIPICHRIDKVLRPIHILRLLFDGQKHIDCSVRSQKNDEYCGSGYVGRVYDQLRAVYH